MVNIYLDKTFSDTFIQMIFFQVYLFLYCDKNGQISKNVHTMCIYIVSVQASDFAESCTILD